MTIRYFFAEGWNVTAPPRFIAGNEILSRTALPELRLLINKLEHDSPVPMQSVAGRTGRVAEPLISVAQPRRKGCPTLRFVKGGR